MIPNPPTFAPSRSMRGRVVRMLVACALTLSACASPWTSHGSAPTPSESEAVRWAWSVVPTLPVDPVRVPTSWSGLPADPGAQVLVDLTTRSLLRPSASGWSPDLAASYEYDSKTRTAVLHLDGSAKWSDGTPVTAADVVETLGRAKRDAKSPFHEAALALADPGGLVAAADGTVHWIFRPGVQVGPAFAQLVTLGIAPAGGVTLEDGSYQPASGPFVARLAAGGGLDLAANPHGPSKPDRAVLRFVPIPQGATLGDLGKSVDVAPVTAEGWASASEASGARLLLRPLGSVAMLAFNTRDRVDGPSLDTAARGALGAALDPSTVLAAAGPGALPAPLPMPVLGLGAQAVASALGVGGLAAGGTLSPSSDRANQALDAAGWTRAADGRRQVGGAPVLLHLAYVKGDAQLRRVAEAVAAAWTALGVKTEPDPLEGADFARRVYLDHAFDVALVLWQPADPYDPGPLYASASRFNVSGWSDAASDSALAAAEGSVDLKDRLAALAAWWRVAGSSRAYVPLYAPATPFAARPDLQGVEPSAADFGAERWTKGSR